MKGSFSWAGVLNGAESGTGGPQGWLAFSRLHIQRFIEDRNTTTPGGRRYELKNNVRPLPDTLGDSSVPVELTIGPRFTGRPTTTSSGNLPEAGPGVPDAGRPSQPSCSSSVFNRSVALTSSRPSRPGIACRYHQAVRR